MTHRRSQERVHTGDCYTIALAFLLFGEGREVNFSFYLGIALIVLSVVLQSLRALRKKDAV